MGSPIQSKIWCFSAEAFLASLGWSLKYVDICCFTTFSRLTNPSTPKQVIYWVIPQDTSIYAQNIDDETPLQQGLLSSAPPGVSAPSTTSASSARSSQRFAKQRRAKAAMGARMLLQSANENYSGLILIIYIYIYICVCVCMWYMWYIYIYYLIWLN